MPLALHSGVTLIWKDVNLPTGNIVPNSVSTKLREIKPAIGEKQEFCEETTGEKGKNAGVFTTCQIFVSLTYCLLGLT